MNEELSKAISLSKFMLALPDNWDDEGAVAYQKGTWDRAASFLWACEHVFHDYTQLHIPAPRITPGPDGTIDIHWKNTKRELLLNIPVSPDEHASFYGDNTLGQQVKGKFDTNNVSEWLVFWLVQ